MENQPSISSDLIRGHIDTIILHTLLESDKFAQQISDAVKLKSENAYEINQATLYSSLKRLESLKLVSSYWYDFDGGRRKFFKITDFGKKTIEDNLSSWEYSRSVIDKLMNLSPAPVVVMTKNEVAYSNNVYIEKNVDESIKQNVENEIVNTIKYDTLSEEKEKNFRSILNGLIEISNRNTHEKTEQQNVNLEPIVSYAEESEKISDKSDVLKFNETINETDYNANKSNFNGKIDYGDLTLKAEKEGYVIKISSKDSAKPVGNLLINKLNFAVSAIVFFIALIELGILYALFTSAFESPSVISLSAISLLPFIVFGILYFAEKHKLGKRKILADSILTAAIIAFNLILVNFAVGFLFEIDFTNTALLLSALIIPIIYYVNFVLFFVFRFVFASKKAFSYK